MWQALFGNALMQGYAMNYSIDIMPVKGLRLFENIVTDKIKLKRIKVGETMTSRTSITFKTDSWS